MKNTDWNVDEMVAEEKEEEHLLFFDEEDLLNVDEDDEIPEGSPVAVFIEAINNPPETQKAVQAVCSRVLLVNTFLQHRRANQ